MRLGDVCAADSLMAGNYHSSATRAVCRWLQDVLRQARVPVSWSVGPALEVVQQRNNFDCGTFAAAMVMMVAKGGQPRDVSYACATGYRATLRVVLQTLVGSVPATTEQVKECQGALHTAAQMAAAPAYALGIYSGRSNSVPPNCSTDFDMCGARRTPQPASLPTTSPTRSTPTSPARTGSPGPVAVDSHFLCCNGGCSGTCGWSRSACDRRSGHASVY